MKRFVFCAVLLASSATVLASDLALSIVVGQPGFYGQIELGDYPPPRVVYRRPLIVERVDFDRPPIYLRVPPGHASNWKKHCRAYGACGERVYFVQNSWYQNEYVPRYRQRQGERRDEHWNDARGYGPDDRRERPDDHRERNQGRGHPR